MTGEIIAFMGLAISAIIGGVLLLHLSKVFHMVIALVLTFISIAGIYVLLSAEFLAVVQILIYSGAITIIMLFAIMLTRHQDTSEPTGNRVQKLFLLIGIAIFALSFYFGIYNLDLPESATKLHENNTEQIGVAIFSKYVIPFELTSIVLLVALIGAIVLAKKDDEKEAKE